ncbi:MAG: hypothetical protein PHR06_12840, partial [Candidatus Cloacimonetes bacterium]|nr:hypothetical protein [Candidatus Cloacimonadota bacterium]
MDSKKVEKLVNYTRTLVNIPSPTGFTGVIKDYLIENAQKKKIKFNTTKKGAVIYEFPGKKPSGLMLASHVDTLGAMVKEVGESTIKIAPLGGFPSVYVIGDYCKIHLFNGEEISGTILPVNPAVHVNKGIYDNKLTFDNVEIRVDLEITGKKKLSDLVKIGNFVSFDPKFSYVNGFIKSRHLDDKASAAVLLTIADILSESEQILPQNVFLYFNITEETGQGLAGMPDIDELLIVDMGVVGD